MSLKEQYIERIKILKGIPLECKSNTYLGYKIETKKTLSFTLSIMALSLIMYRALIILCYFLIYISGLLSDIFMIIGLTLIVILDIAMLLLFLISLLKQPRCFFIDIRDKKIWIERVFYNLKYDISDTEFFCYGVFIKLIHTHKTFHVFDIRKEKIRLFVPMEKVDKENLIFLMNDNEGNFICQNKRCKKCCDLNAKLKLDKTIDEQWEELGESAM